ncbi:MAG: UPF0236 family transposase-like protein [Bacillota bacterium]
MQQERSPNQEIKMVMSHEGWSPRHPASDEYELLQRNYHVTLDGKDFWEEASRKLYSIYDIDEKTWVVINGDRAGWIRIGGQSAGRAAGSPGSGGEEVSGREAAGRHPCVEGRPADVDRAGAEENCRQ